jgi:nicotinate-nucleotide adenylyltransferase
LKKFGVFAGTFDPLHNGHLAFARQALRSGLDKVYFLPEPRPRRKQGVRALEHRQGMIEVAIQDDTRLGLIKLEQARFTPYETLPVLQQRFPNAEIVLLFGDDVLRHIADWPRIAELADSVRLLIATRR